MTLARVPYRLAPSLVPLIGLLLTPGFARGQTPPPADAEVIVFTGARIIDGTGHAPLENATLTTPFFTAAVEPGLLASWLTPEYAAKLRASPTTPKNRAAFETALKNVKTLHDAGVLVAMGTDSGAMPTRVAGFGEHRELQLLVRAGLSPMAAIVCATAHSAAVIGQADERGTLTPGKRADFLVLEANPLDDIRNTIRLAAVWHGGRQVVPFVQRPAGTAAQP